MFPSLISPWMEYGTAKQYLRDTLIGQTASSKLTLVS